MVKPSDGLIARVRALKTADLSLREYALAATAIIDGQSATDRPRDEDGEMLDIDDWLADAIRMHRLGARLRKLERRVAALELQS